MLISLSRKSRSGMLIITEGEDGQQKRKQHLFRKIQLSFPPRQFVVRPVITLLFTVNSRVVRNLGKLAPQQLVRYSFFEQPVE